MPGTAEVFTLLWLSQSFEGLFGKEDLHMSQVRVLYTLSDS